MASDDSQEQGSHKEQPIIIKKVKKGGHAGGHGGAWKVAYADFVTAMMAFFIVMWILGQSEKVKQNVSAYFKEPGAFNFVTGKRAVPIDLGLTPEPGTGKDGEGGKAAIIKFDKETTDTLYSKLIQKATKDSAMAADRVAKTGEQIKRQLNDILAQKPEFEKILSSIKIEITKEGLRIELIESSESLFFEVGSARLKKEAKVVLQSLAREIGTLPNKVEIEGHTDSRGYGSKNGYTNWELSADRANTARRTMESGGLWEGQVVKVTGYADKRLRNPDNPFDVTNRRVSILIKQISSDQFLPKTGSK